MLAIHQANKKKDNYKLFIFCTSNIKCSSRVIMNDYHQGGAVYHEIFSQLPLHRTQKLLQMTMMSYQIEKMSFPAHVWKMFVVLEHVAYVSVDALVPVLRTISSDPLTPLNWTPPITPQYCPLLLFWKRSELLPHLEKSRIPYSVYISWV